MADQPTPVQFTVTERDARWLASYAVRANDWHILKVIEAAMDEAGLNEPTVMDIYSENARLHAELREWRRSSRSSGSDKAAAPQRRRKQQQ